MGMRREWSIHEEELERVELTEVGNGSGVLCEIQCRWGSFLVTDGGREVGEGGGGARVAVCGREQGKEKEGCGTRRRPFYRGRWRGGKGGGGV
jgi:hypothetical protein